MRFMLRRTMMMILIMAFLAPALHARTSPRSSGWPTTKVESVAHVPGFLSMVWNLLASTWEKDDNGGHLDPSGGGTPPPPSTPNGTPDGGDNGGHLDPSGGTGG